MYPFVVAYTWVIFRRLNFTYRRFRTLCSIFTGLWRRTSLYLPAYEDGTDRVFRNVSI